MGYRINSLVQVRGRDSSGYHGDRLTKRYTNSGNAFHAPGAVKGWHLCGMCQRSANSYCQSVSIHY